MNAYPLHMDYPTRRDAQVYIYSIYCIIYHLSLNHIKLPPTNVTNSHFTLVNHLLWHIIFLGTIYIFSSTFWLYPELTLDISHPRKYNIWQKVEDGSISNYMSLKIGPTWIPCRRFASLFSWVKQKRYPQNFLKSMTAQK